MAHPFGESTELLPSHSLEYTCLQPLIDQVLLPFLQQLAHSMDGPVTIPVTVTASRGIRASASGFSSAC